MFNEDTLGLDDYKSVLRTVERRFEIRQKRLDTERRQAIEALNEAWPKMGGSAEDIARFAAYQEAPPQIEKAVVHPPQDDAPTLNGSSERTVPMKAVRRATEDILNDEATEIITQSLIQDRLLAEFPDAEIQPLRVSISRLLRQLKELNVLALVEEGRGGAPNRYRKNEEIRRTILDP